MLITRESQRVSKIWTQGREHSCLLVRAPTGTEVVPHFE